MWESWNIFNYYFIQSKIQTIKYNNFIHQNIFCFTQKSIQNPHLQSYYSNMYVSYK
jgi:hypothetical protein